MKKRIVEIDLVRGIAAILMILGHSFIVYPIDISSVSWCKALGHFIYTFHMEAFFVLAGAVYYCSDYDKFIKKKVSHILVPYFFFGILTLLLKAFGGKAINGNEGVVDGLLRMIFRGGNYWFLYTLFLIFATYPLVERLLHSWKAEAVLGFIVLWLPTFFVFPHFLTLSALFHYLPYFILGKIVFHLLGKNGSESITLPSQKAIAIILVSLTVFCVLDFWEIKRGIDLIPFFFFARAVSMIAVLYMIAMLWTQIVKDNAKKVNGFITDCSKYSLQLYLFNGFLLTAFRIVLCSILHISSPVIIVSTIWIGNLIVTLTLCKFVIPRIPGLRFLCSLK